MPASHSRRREGEQQQKVQMLAHESQAIRLRHKFIGHDADERERGRADANCDTT